MKSNEVVGIYCYTYPEHEGKENATCNHCVALVPKYLGPKVQSLILAGEALDVEKCPTCGLKGTSAPCPAATTPEAEGLVEPVGHSDPLKEVACIAYKIVDDFESPFFRKPNKRG